MDPRSTLPHPIRAARRSATERLSARVRLIQAARRVRDGARGPARRAVGGRR